MKFISRAAVAAVLSASAMAGVAVPTAAFAAKKDISVSNEFRGPASAAQAALKAKDFATAESQAMAAAQVAKSDDERYFLASIMLPIALHKNDWNSAATQLDTLLASDNVGKEDRVYYTTLRGDAALEMKQPQQAIAFYNQAQQLGAPEGNLTLKLARAYFDSSNLAQGVAQVDKAIQGEKAAGRKPPEGWYEYVVARLYKAGDLSGTATWLSRQVKEYPTPKTWRSVIAVYRQGATAGGKTLSNAQLLDTYRLQRTTKALADEADYYAYASLAQKLGLPGEAKAVIEEGRAAGKIRASHTDFNKLYESVRGGATENLAPLEKRATSASDGKLAAQTADAYLANGNTAKAIDLYTMALSKGGVDASNVNLHLGIALANAGRNAEAKAALAKVTAAPDANIAAFWTSYLDQSAA